MVKQGLDFFFSMIKWVFNDFLIKVKILDISVLYYFLAIMLLGIVIGGLINTTNAGNLVVSSSNARRRSENEEMRQAKLKSIRKGK